MCAEAVGGVAAGLMAGPLYGTGATWLKKMLPWIRPTEDADGNHHELENQTSVVTETEMAAPLYSGKPGQSGKHGPTANGVSTIV